jgi:hypothetical protein
VPENAVRILLLAEAKLEAAVQVRIMKWLLPIAFESLATCVPEDGECSKGQALNLTGNITD